MLEGLGGRECQYGSDISTVDRSGVGILPGSPRLSVRPGPESWSQPSTEPVSRRSTRPRSKE